MYYDIKEMELIPEGKKHIGFIQRPKLNKNISFGAADDIYMPKKLSWFW